MTHTVLMLVKYIIAVMNTETTEVRIAYPFASIGYRIIVSL